MDTLGATIGSLFNVVRLFVLFDLISSGSRKNDNLWKSLGGIMVNGAPREVPRVLNGVPQEYIEGPPRTKLRTLGNLPRGSIHHYTPSAFPQIVPFFLDPLPAY